MNHKNNSPWLVLFIVSFIFNLLLIFCCFMLLYSTQNWVSSDLALAYDKGYSAGHDAGYSDGYSASKSPENDTGENEDKEVHSPDDSEEYEDTLDGTNHTPETPISPTIIKPGTIVHESKYICTCPFTVDLPDDDNLYYIYLEYVQPSLSSEFAMDQRHLNETGELYISNLSSDIHGDDISYITRHGSFDTFDVPPGVYRLWYCSGSYWYGIGNYFGDDTVWYTSDDLLSFYETYTNVVGNTITLYNISGGNFSTYNVDPSDVPFK